MFFCPHISQQCCPNLKKEPHNMWGTSYYIPAQQANTMAYWLFIFFLLSNMHPSVNYNGGVLLCGIRMLKHRFLLFSRLVLIQFSHAICAVNCCCYCPSCPYWPYIWHVSIVLRFTWRKYKPIFYVPVVLMFLEVGVSSLPVHQFRKRSYPLLHIVPCP